MDLLFKVQVENLFPDAMNLEVKVSAQASSLGSFALSSDWNHVEMSGNEEMV